MDNSLILACSKVITTHNFQSKQPLSVYSPHKGLINCATFNHTNKVIASSGQDGRIVLVSAEEKEKLLAEFFFDGKKQSYSPTHSSVNCCLFSPHSKYIAAGSSDSLVKVWAMSNHKEVCLTLKNHSDSVSSLAWTKNQDILASASLGGNIFLNAVKTGKQIEQLTIKAQDGISCIKISQGSDYCRLAACTESGSIRVWDLDASRNCKLTSSFENINKAAVTCLSFSTFNPVLMVTSSVDQNLTFYDISQKKAVKTISTQQPLTSVNFHSDGHTLLAGGMYGGLFVYDLRKPQRPKQKLIGHDTAIKYIDFQKERQSQQQSRQSKEQLTSTLNNNQYPRQQRQQTSRGDRFGKGTVGISSASKLPKEKKQERDNQQNLASKRQQIQKLSAKQISYRQSELPPPANTVVTAIPPTTNTTLKSTYVSQNKRQQLIAVPPVNTPITPLQNNFIPSQPMTSTNINKSRQTIMPQAFQQLRIKLQESISEKFQMVHLEIIKQFQIQQQEIRDIMQKSTQEGRMKDQRIRQLEAQLAKMKRNRY